MLKYNDINIDFKFYDSESPISPFRERGQLSINIRNHQNSMEKLEKKKKRNSIHMYFSVFLLNHPIIQPNITSAQ
jgi:hypothetical protein